MQTAIVILKNNITFIPQIVLVTQFITKIQLIIDLIDEWVMVKYYWS